MPPLKYFAPNTCTAVSLVLGLSSAFLSSQGNFRLAAWMILWGVLLDKADGSIARLFKATSEFGVQFDSFADFVVFGFAPAALIYFRLLATNQYAGWGEIALMIAAGLYVVALAVRLARFNIAAAHKGLFFGIPGTLMGAIVAACYLTWDKYALSPKILVYGPVLLLVGALLMVSNVRIPKLAVRKSLALNVFQFGNVIAAYILAPLMLLPEYLLSLALLYTLGGIAWCLVRPERPEPEPEEAEATDDDEQDGEAPKQDDEGHEQLA
ncbi:MAG: CDP-alcohol phosphatidyltransferase family protein [Deltaproteobacteria bacterium]|nr:CDP-alcohol phosphatidyltransferase family protein [Deltaproteobacteria bacterium]